MHACACVPARVPARARACVRACVRACACVCVCVCVCVSILTRFEYLHMYSIITYFVLSFLKIVLSLVGFPRGHGLDVKKIIKNRVFSTTIVK